MIAMAINRFASLFDGLAQSYLFDPAFRAIVAQDLATGVHENPTGDPRWFTTAYFHRPEELAAEATEAGLDVTGDGRRRGAGPLDQAAGVRRSTTRTAARWCSTWPRA